MKLNQLLLIIITFIPTISSQTCQKTCDKQPIKYPFGTGPGCGDPRFQTYINCNQQQQQLTFITHTGCYPITSIDYNNQILYISDPTMSTCRCTQPSKGFGLDPNAPFTFHDNTVFALLDCSTANSPIYNHLINNSSNSLSLCDPHGASICSLLYSCQAISRLNTPISTCCVYTPVDLGPSFEMDLDKLKCGAYSGLYGFNGLESDPESWKYGVALKYKFNFNNDYPDMCASCEKSNGVCGYNHNNGLYNSYTCNCPRGFNTTNDCFYGASWNNALRLVPWQSSMMAGIIIFNVFAFVWLI